jgi:hypothetical protein
VAAAGPAATHEHIASQFGVTDDLPCADSAFLVPLKRAREFRALRRRLAGRAPHPVYDSWLDDGFHFFVFLLAPDENTDAAATAGVAVFAMHPDQTEPVSAVTVVPTETDGHAEITDLREGGSYVAPLPDQADENPES